MKPFGWCYIGAGGIAFLTAGVITKTGNHRIVSVWNRTKDKAVRFGEAFQACVCDTAEAAMLAPDVDAVYIAVTADKHEEFVRLALQHRLPVLNEKPFAANVRQTRAMFDFAQAQDTYLVEAMWTWFNPVAKQVLDWVRSEAIGTVTAVKMLYSLPILAYFKSGRHLDPERCGGAAMDIGVYPITYCYRLFGAPKAVRCAGVLENGVDVTERIELDYDGFTAELEVSMLESQGETILITGSKGAIEVPWFHQAFEAHLHPFAPLSLARAHQSRPDLFNAQFDAVADEIRAGLKTSRFVPPEATLAVMGILDECRRQMHVVYPCE